MNAEVRLKRQKVGLKKDIRILSVRLDLSLRWQAYIRLIETKSVHLMNALYTIIDLI
jgi:hypothetical protein